MKALALALSALALAGCDSMPQRGYAAPMPPPYQVPFYAMPIPSSAPAYQAPAQPTRCTSRWVGNTRYTDCY